MADQNYGAPVPTNYATGNHIEQDPIRENIAREIIIRQLNHGYMVQVGCQSMAIESSTKLLSLFAEYISNPNATEQKYREGKLLNQ